MIQWYAMKQEGAKSDKVKTKNFIEWKIAKSYKPFIIEVNKACCGYIEEILD